MSISVGLDIGASALRAAQIEVDTAANNISNVNTPGYSREQALLSAVPPPQATFLSSTWVEQQGGLGVAVSGVTRLRDLLIDGPYRAASAANSGAQFSSNALQQAEALFNEPSSTGISAQLSQFFGAFSTLAGQPESAAARTALVQQAGSLASEFNSVAGGLTEQISSLDGNVSQDVSQINSAAAQVAQLNGQILIATEAGQHPNTLLDQRDQLLDQIAGLAGTSATQQPDGTMNVSLGGHALVTGTTADSLTTVADPSNGNHLKVEFASDSSSATFSSGEVQAIQQTRDTTLPGMLTSLNQVAAALITAVNTAHKGGYGLNGASNLSFFTGAGASDIAVNPTIVGDPTNVAAADAPNEPGNNAVALAIANLQNADVLNGNTTTIGGGYAALVASAGGAAQQAQSTAGNQSAILAQIQNQRQSVAGVSIDDEMTNLIQGQHAYQAAAQIITTVNSMLGTLVNMIGS